MDLAQLSRIANPIAFLFTASLAVAAANLQACGKCADDFARELGADYAFTDVVHKASEPVLSISVLVQEAATTQPVTSATVDLRGNTDEAWQRAIDDLYRNVLSARLEKLNK